MSWFEAFYDRNYKDANISKGSKMMETSGAPTRYKRFDFLSFDL